ncbi:MAG: DUF2357 domain-containing protein [Bacteroidales bacterium]|nr:DUF2357 domain-containing protein [Bacteroidales bacterium]
MELLRIDHTDFTLTVESTRFDAMWQKGVGNLGKEKLTSTYRWGDSVTRVVLTRESGEEVEITPDVKSEPAVFFEQTDYSVWVDFHSNNVTEASFDSQRRDVNERFSWKKDKQLLAGFLNYGNEIGRADMPIRYIVDGVQKRFVFSYDVISAKLDYHNDWEIIVKDIEEEYRMLSLDYLRRTYHGIQEGAGETFDLIWWNIFHSLQEQFVKACHNIIDRPRHRLRSIEDYKRADQIRHFNPMLEQQIAEHRSEEMRLYRVEEQQNTYNTPENRFLKHALGTIQKRYSTLADRILRQNREMAETERIRISETAQHLTRLTKNPFFRTVGNYEGMKQESLVLQRDVNYSKIYRTFSILKKSFSLNDGLYRMETKDIATLYEIWCFIQVEKVVKELTHADVEQESRQELNGLFTYSLGKGEHSKIIFKKDDVTLAELIYNPRHNEKTDDVKGIGNLESKTVPQKPDIVLQLTKDDLQEGMKLTYLFDAKYRLEKDGANDVPPDDAINQMHRYRDAIYFNAKHDNEQLKKEVIGGYILFPGKMDELSRFRHSIDEVNIGAFPMRPDQKQHQLLTDFIADLIRKRAVDVVEQVIPQKGLRYEPGDAIYFIISGTKKENPDDWDKIKDGEDCRFCCGFKGPREDVDLQKVKYLAPIVGHTFYGYYKVKAVRTKTLEDEQYPVRVEFELQGYKKLETPVKYGLADAPRGKAFSHHEFLDYCKTHPDSIA